jgi:predicted ferric reductase
MATISKFNLITNRVSAFRLTHQHLLTLGYFILLLLPFAIAQSLGMLSENVYRTILSVVNLIAMMAFFVQFPLAGRLKRFPLFANIDWGMTKHKQLGKYLGVFFFLHPLLILAPKLFVSFDEFTFSVVNAVTSPQLLTGLVAWGVMLVWVLMSIYKDKLSISYETWRLCHVIGFVVIASLATLHVTTVGSHGQYHHQFNLLWWSLYSLSMLLVIYNYFVKPRLIKKQKFSIKSVEKISESDWQLDIKTESARRFAFDAGQFVWLNTSGSVYNLNQHPFSIVSQQNNSGELSFIIRELGDYTAALDKLQIGQNVFVDGPYGNMSLEKSRKAAGITLIAGGAGIAPMIGLLRELAKQHDPRPIRLLYGNQHIQKMVCLDELISLENTMKNFKLQLLCEHTENCPSSILPIVKQGLIGKSEIENSISDETNTSGLEADWVVYLSGPEKMISVTRNHLKEIGVTTNHIYFEQLSF